MNRWGPKPRTKSDMAADAQSFCVSSTRKAFEAKTVEDVIRMAGGDKQVGTYWHAWRMGKDW